MRLPSLFGSSNARYIKKLQPKVDAINALEPKYQAMSDAELKQQTVVFRERLADGETLDDILDRSLCRVPRGRPAVSGHAALRRAAHRRHGAALGSIAEMITGEGKTLVATLPAYLNALEGQGACTSSR